MAQINTQNTAVEIPFDLNQIFSLTYEFQQLKLVLEHLFGELKKNSDATNRVDMKLVSKMMLIDKLKTDNDNFAKDIKNIRDICKELEHKSVAHDGDLSALKTDSETCKMNLSLLNRQIGALPQRMNDAEDKLEDFSNRIEELEKKIGNVGGSGVDEKLLNDYLKRLEKCEKKSKKAKDLSKKNAKKHKKWKPKWEHMQKDIEDLKKLMNQKTDQSLFDEEIDRLKNLLNQLASSDKDISAPIIQSGPSFSSKEMADIREAIKLVWQHEKRLEGFDFDKLKEKLSDLKSDIEKNEKKFEKFEHSASKDIKMLKEWCARLEQMLADSGKGSSTVTDAQFSLLVKRVEKLEEKFILLQKSQTMQSSAGFRETTDTLGDENLRDLTARLNAMQAEIDALRNEFAKWLKEFQDCLNGKADLDALQNLERLLLERLGEMVKGLTKQLADKNDTKKALKMLERQLKNLYDIFMQSKGHHENEDDAMFTRKPLGGTSCASCEKDIVNLQGRKADYLPWSKFPFRDPSERIARVGQGFSKMLSMINPDTLSRFDHNGKFNSIHASHNHNHFNPHNLKHNGSQEGFYQEEMEDHVPVNSTLPLHKPGTAGKTMNNFYPGQQMQDMGRRPGSAQVPKPRVKNNLTKGKK
eukprot:403370209